MMVRQSRYVLVLSLLLSVGCAPARHDTNLVARLPSILHKLDNTGAIVSARVIELPSGRELFADDPDRPFTPASNMKLVVTAASLAALGPEHTFKTWLVGSGDDLVIVGSGDPAIGDPRIAQKARRTTETVLDEWAKVVQDKGYTWIAGDICFDESYFEARQIHPNWHEDDLVEWYACPVSGLNFNDNCIDVSVQPGEAGKPVAYKVSPATGTVDIVNSCLSGDKGDPVDVRRAPEHNIFTVTGTVTKAETLKSKPVTEPGLLIADAFRMALERRGIRLDGTIRRVKVERLSDGSPCGGKILAVHESAMADVMWRTNKSSQNLFAECLAKTLGRRWAAQRGRDEPGSWANAAPAIRAGIAKLGVSTRGLTVDDGSGLSDHNRVTARLLTDLLRAMFVHPYAEAFRASMARGGVDGTIEGRMSDLRGRIFAKTGYIGGVRTLSGYVRTKGGQWLAFSFLYNRIDGTVKPYEKLQDDCCRVLVDWQSDSQAPEAATSSAPERPSPRHPAPHSRGT